MKRMLFPCPDILVNIAIADAYAMATEYLDPTKHRNHIANVLTFYRYHAHPNPDIAHRESRYTDDTEMSIANALVLLEAPRPLTKLAFAQSYVDEFHYGGRRRGYSRGLQSLLEHVNSGDELLAELKPNSTKNGAAMRAVPFGVIPDVNELLEIATLQATVTHDTPEGRFSARAVALMAHYALYERGELSKIGAFCTKHLPQEDQRFGHIFMLGWNGGPVVDRAYHPVSITTVHAVAHLVMHETSLMRILERSIRFGGDTDSVAAIAWGIASPRYQHEALPEFMERDLEGGSTSTGVVRLRTLGSRLMQNFNSF